jgi:hypothetical protein
MLEKNFQHIIDAANACNQRLWIENETSLGNEEVIPIYRKFKPLCSHLGVEIRPDTENINIAKEIGKTVSNKDIVKLMTPLQKAQKKEKNSKKTDMFNLYKECIDALMAKKVSSLTILEDDPKLIGRIMASNKEYKRNLILEIPLGYSNRKLNAMQKNKLNLSIYVPYGKDWIPYFINRLAEGRVKNIASVLLNGEKTGVGLNVKNEGAKAG